MARRKKEIEITVIDNPEDSNVRLVQINGHTIGTITQSDNRFDCVVGDSIFMKIRRRSTSPSCKRV